MATEIWVNIGSGNGLLPDGTKPLPEPMLTDHQWSPSDIHIRAILQEMPQRHQSLNSIWKLYIQTFIKFPRGQWVNLHHRTLRKPDKLYMKHWHETEHLNNTAGKTAPRATPIHVWKKDIQSLTHISLQTTFSNTLRPEPNGCLFAHNISMGTLNNTSNSGGRKWKCIFDHQG